MMGDSVYVPVVAVGIISLILLGMTGVPLATDYEGEIHESAEWCDNHDGELVQNNVIGPQGGLYCEFDNGTSVHMNNVNTGEKT
jgi:hypothetical protein